MIRPASSSRRSAGTFIFRYLSSGTHVHGVESPQAILRVTFKADRIRVDRETAGNRLRTLGEVAFRALVRVLEMRVRVSPPGSVGGEKGRGEAENAGHGRQQSSPESYAADLHRLRRPSLRPRELLHEGGERLDPLDGTAL